MGAESSEVELVDSPESEESGKVGVGGGGEACMSRGQGLQNETFMMVSSKLLQLACQH